MTIAAAGRPAVPLRRVRNPVLLVLVAIAAAAVATTGFVSYAPNRLVSGRPIMLWAAVGPLPLAAVAALGALLLAAAFRRPSAALHRRVAAAAALLLLLALAASGAAAARLATGAGAAARISLGAGFWMLVFCAGLVIVDALQRLAAGPASRLLVAAAIVLGAAALALAGRFDALSLAHEYESHRQAFAAQLARHVFLVAASVGPAVVIGFPLGVAAARRPSLRGPLFAVLNLLQTIPSLALFGLLLVPLSTLAEAVPALAAHGVGGVGVAPAIIALVLYALLPIVRNTAAGLIGVDRAVIDAARGLGMSARQIFRRVELPLAAPVLLAGLRIVLVETIGLAVVAALIGAGGLGAFVFGGLGQDAIGLVLLGALPAIFLALAADFLLSMLAEIARRRVAR